MESVNNIISEKKMELDETPVEKAALKTQPNRFNQIIFLVALAITLNAFLSTSESNELLKIGDPVPPFALKLINGQEIANVDFQSKPTMYFFYANWCPCSHRSMKWIKMAANNNSSTEFSTLGIGIQDSSKKLEEFAKLHELTFPVSAGGSGKSMANSIGVQTTPTTIFADSSGIIRWIFVGRVDRYDQLEEGLKQILDSSKTVTVS